MERKPVSKRFAISKRKRNNTTLGNDFEAQAAQELRTLGWSILSQQYHTPYGEIDIVAQKEELLWFVEVKGSSTSVIDYDAVNLKKQSRIRKSITHWFMEHTPVFEAFEVVVCFRTTQGLDWIVGAFE